MALRRPASIASKPGLDEYLGRRGVHRLAGAPPSIQVGKNITATVTLDDGRRLFLKQGRNRGARDEGALLNEGLFHLCAQERQLDKTGDSLARCRYHDREADILVFDMLPDTESLAERLERSGELSPATSRDIGSALGTVHAGTADDAREVTTLGDADSLVPDVLALTPAAYARLSGGEIELTRLIQGDRPLTDALAALARTWQRRCVIHGDLRTENILVPKSANAPATLVDWELARHGDPAGDLGSMMGDAVRVCVDAVEPSEEAIGHWTRPAVALLDRLRPALRSMWSGYLSTAGQLLHGRPALPILSVAHAGVFLLHRIAAGGQAYGFLTPRELMYAGVARRLILDPASGLKALVPPEEARGA